jgi:RNA-binding protein NOB1
LRYPSETSLARVKSYAKKTGDLASLSETDMIVIALAVTIVEKNKKIQFLRKEPLELEQEINKKYQAYLAH